MRHFTPECPALRGQQAAGETPPRQKSGPAFPPTGGHPDCLPTFCLLSLYWAVQLAGGSDVAYRHRKSVSACEVSPPDQMKESFSIFPLHAKIAGQSYYFSICPTITSCPRSPRCVEWARKLIMFFSFFSSVQWLC